MGCERIIDMAHEREGLPLFGRLRVALHLLACPRCAAEAGRLELGMRALREGFMPPPPNLEDAVMARIAEEGGLDAAEAAAPGGFSLKGWVFAGLVLLVSLTTIFFGMEFRNVALAAGVSFMVPIGITVGIVLTVYGALFIGSHLKKLSERFGLESR